MNIKIPKLSLVVLVGPSGSGKSTFARKHFLPTEVLSSDYCRGLVSDDENDQSATKDTFDVLRYIAGKRLAKGRLTVIDATNVQPEARKPLVHLAKEYHCLPVAIVLNPPEKVCLERNRGRDDRTFGPHVVRQQRSQLRRSVKALKREGFRHIGKKGLVQPAVKCRGKEYLRIIYSPDYDSEEILPRLRSRSLGRKRSLALREFALGLEAVERFVRREPLRRVHQCVFGVLALESEPIDPRL